VEGAVPQSAWLLALQVLYPKAPPCYFDAMPYEVTAARKRPQSFEQLAGQEFVAATLEKSLETGRIAHAYLFSGPRGCGKTSTARILAKALNCEKGPTAEPCGVCDSCRSITAGSSLDVIEIDGASNTSVDNVRQIKDEVQFPPNSSRYKIYIIDEVHMLSTSAFNALLKTIEEPPHYVIFMFATTEQHKVPATIKSRCQQFTFRLVSSDVIKELLASAAADIGVKTEDEALLWIARESGGSIRDAYTLFDQVVSFADGNITAALIREKLGLVGQDRMNALFGHFVAGDTAGALSALDSILGGGVSPEQFVADSVEYCRALLLLKNGLTRESLLGAPISSFDLGIAEALSGEKIEKILSLFLSAYRNLKESIDPRYELDLAAAKASHINDYVPPSDVVKAVSALKRYLEKNAQAVAKLSGESSDKTAARPASVEIPRKTESFRLPETAVIQPPAGARPETRPDARSDVRAEPRPDARPEPRPDTSAPEVQIPESAKPQPPVDVNDPAKLSELKKILVGDIRKSNVLLATTLEKSQAWRFRGEILHITVSTPMEFDLLRRFVGIIAEVLAQRLGGSQKIEVELAKDRGITAGSSGTIDSPFDPPGAGAGSIRKEAGGSESAQRSETRPPTAFNDSLRTDGEAGAGRASASAGSRASGFTPNSGREASTTPNLSLDERERIGIVERVFKGSLSGFVPTASGPAVSAEDKVTGNAGRMTERHPTKASTTSAQNGDDSPADDRSAAYADDSGENDVSE
jgi:DNA polymerase III subunit gamma/tau